MSKLTTLYKGDTKRRVGTESQRRSLLAQGWSEKEPQAPAPQPTPAPPAAKPADAKKTDSK